MKVWMIAVARERGIPIDPEPRIYSTMEELSRGLQSSLVEGFGVTAEECWRLSKEVKFDRLVVAINDGRITEEYVILVHRDSGIEGVGDLRGRRLLVLQNPRMSLATIWLDTLLIRKGLDPSPKFFSGVTSVNKLSQVVLPVFFRKNDACVVTRRGFQTMTELNPASGQATARFGRVAGNGAVRIRFPLRLRLAIQRPDAERNGEAGRIPGWSADSDPPSGRSHRRASDVLHGRHL